MPLKDKAARLEYVRTWRANNRSRVRSYNIAYRKVNPRKDYDWHRLRRTGVTPEQFAEQLIKQKGLCALCNLPFGDQPPHADHDHVTNVFRGLLHRNCNVGLGFFKDDARLLEMAVVYLRKFQN